MSVDRQYIIHGVTLKLREICLPKSSIQDKKKARALRKNGVLSEVVELLCEMFCELCVQDSQQEVVWVGGVEVVLCESC